MNKLKGVLIDVNTGEARATTINDDLSSFYSALNCTTIDIVSRKIGTMRKYFSIVCDDEGLLKDNPTVSAFDDNGKPALVGNLFITGGMDYERELTSLTEEEADYVLGYVKYVATLAHPEVYRALIHCGLFA